MKGPAGLTVTLCWILSLAHPTGAFFGTSTTTLPRTRWFNSAPAAEPHIRRAVVPHESIRQSNVFSWIGLLVVLQQVGIAAASSQAETKAPPTRLESLTLEPISLISGEVELPGSKSLSNRVLLLSALAEVQDTTAPTHGRSVRSPLAGDGCKGGEVLAIVTVVCCRTKGTTKVENVLDSEDIRYMLDVLKTLNVPVESDAEAKTVEIVGNGGPFEVSSRTELFLGNAGTAMRPLTAVVCAGRGDFVMDGTARMRERPIADLVDGLKQLGVDIECSETGCPPVNIKASGLKGGTARVSGKISSQYLSALLMAAPLSTGGDVVINIADELVSAPYVHMTIKLMDKFGVKVQNDGDTRFTVPGGQKYVSPGTFAVEGDASSASYFLGGAAITGGPVTVRGCGKDSVQGDVKFAEVLEKMGATLEWGPNSMTVSRDGGGSPLKGVDVDCGEIPDAAMTLAVVALFAEGPTKIRNVYNWRVKETERMKAIVTELRKLGAEVEEGRDYCVVNPPEAVEPGVAIDTYDDHRMAMCFSLTACAGVPVTINDPECTAKTFPTYFSVLSELASDA